MSVVAELEGTLHAWPNLLLPGRQLVAAGWVVLAGGIGGKRCTRDLSGC
jgi:transglutaminase-like putative cysteine protease